MDAPQDTGAIIVGESFKNAKQERQASFADLPLPKFR